MEKHIKNKNILLLYLFILMCSLIFSNELAFINDTGSHLYADELPSTKYYNCYKYTGNIPHFFTHEMVTNPEIAYNSNNVLKKHFDKDCITSKEFLNFLTQLHSKNYCLIDIYDLIGFKNDKPYLKDVYVPFTKKPFLLSFDDMSYDSKNMGLSDKIIVSEDKIASYTSKKQNQIEYDTESISILENFIKEHPDFSYNNARAIICPTGYNGLLGYRITSNEIDNEKDLQDLKIVVDKLKSLNYHFACHTYNHINVKTISCEGLYNDLKLYKEKILPIIGDTNIFCFPCGNYINNGYKMKILKECGYQIFLCVGLPQDIKTYSDTIFLSRKTLDGNSLRNFHNIYSPYFDTYEMYDNESRYIKLTKSKTKDK